MKSAAKICYLISFILSILTFIGYIVSFILFMSVNVEEYARAVCETNGVEFTEAVVAGVSLTMTLLRTLFGILSVGAICSIGLSIYGYKSYEKCIGNGGIILPVFSIIIGILGNILLLISGILYLVDAGTRKHNQTTSA